MDTRAALTDHSPSGIRVDIYKFRGASYSNRGISAHSDEVTLLLPGGGPFKPAADAPAVRIVRGNVPGTIKALVADDQGNPLQGRSMMGGCYLASSDGRFAAECERVLGYIFYAAVPLHDRYEF